MISNLDKMFMQYEIWNEINETIKINIITLMCKSFNRNYSIDFYNKINIRFTLNSSIIGLFIENQTIEGILIFWKYKRFIYLDKFFSVNFKKGMGSVMLMQFLEYIEQYKYSYYKKLLLRTDDKTSRFYLKHPKIKKIFENKKYVYLGTNDDNVKTSKFHWEYEDIYDINIESCFV